MPYSTIVILILTFIVSALDKFVLKNSVKKSGLHKLVKSRYLMPALLLCLLILQIFSEININNENKTRDNNANDAYNTLYATHDTILNVNSSVENLLSNLDSTLSITNEEIKLISGLNQNLENIRLEVDTSINEFYALQEQYEKQIQIEQEKIREAKPNVLVAQLVGIIDSLSFHYQIELYNSGVRLADSIRYHSLAILVDSTNTPNNIVLYNTNTDENNIMSISHVDNIYNSKMLNSAGISIDYVNNFFQVFILLRFTYKDNLTNELFDSFTVYKSVSLNMGTRQFATNIKNSEMEIIKNYLSNNYIDAYNIFYK